MSGRRATYVAPARDAQRGTVVALVVIALVLMAAIVPCAAALLVREVLAVAP